VGQKYFVGSTNENIVEPEYFLVYNGMGKTAYYEIKERHTKEKAVTKCK